MRWKFFIPFLIVVGVVTIFNILFLDVVLKKALVSSGEAIFGAKVEVGQLKTRFSDLSITIKNLAVANRDDVWKNLFETEKISFSMKPLPLLSAKFNIKEMSIEGMKFGSPRKTSGALPPKKLKKLEKKSADDKDGFFSKIMASLYEKGKSQVASLPVADNIAEARKGLDKISSDFVKLDDLETPKEIEKFRNATTEKYTRNETLVKNLRVSERIQPISSAFKEASGLKLSTIEDVKAAAPTLEKLKNTLPEGNKLIQDITTAKEQILSDFGSTADVLKQIDEMKKRDIDRLSQKLKLPTMPKVNIAEALFGSVWISRYNKTIYYIALARKYMPARKKSEEEKIIVKRLKGRDIYFPHPAAPPKFLIEKISISGVVGDINFSGVIKDITNDPALLGRPTTINIAGTAGSRSLLINGVLDHTSEIPRDTLSVSYKGLEGSALGISDINSDYLPSFEKSSAGILAEGSFVGDEINGKVSIVTKGLKVRDVPSGDEVRKIMADVWKGIDSISVVALLTSKKGEDVRFSVSSDADKILQDRISRIFGEKVAEARRKIEQQVSQLVDGKKNEALKEFETKKKAVTDEIASKESEARAQVEQAKAKVTEIENKIKEIEEREKSRLNEEKKKVEEQLKKQGGEKLEDLKKNLFK